MTTTEPKWLTWARALQALAQTGLTFATDAYDRERYERLRKLSAEIYQAHTGEPRARILAMFAEQAGYATPKVDVRAAVFDACGRLLLVREIADGRRWTLPGGWADVNITPAGNVAKEVCEESGYDVEVVKLAAIWDRTRQEHPAGVFSCYKLFFVCKPTGGTARTSLETSEVAWFDRERIPDELSLGRVLPRRIERMFEHWERPDLPTDFD